MEETPEKKFLKVNLVSDVVQLIEDMAAQDPEAWDSNDQEHDLLFEFVDRAKSIREANDA